MCIKRVITYTKNKILNIYNALDTAPDLWIIQKWYYDILLHEWFLGDFFAVKMSSGVKPKRREKIRHCPKLNCTLPFCVESRMGKSTIIDRLVTPTSPLGKRLLIQVPVKIAEWNKFRLWLWTPPPWYNRKVDKMQSTPTPAFKNQDKLEFTMKLLSSWISEAP